MVGRILELARETAAAGKFLDQRLTIYPAYIREPERWMHESVRGAVMQQCDATGFARRDSWVPGEERPVPEVERALLDQAPAHVAKRAAIPSNVVLIWLPPYSPELNPVERLWEDLKSRLDVVDVRVRSSLQGLRDHVADLIRCYQSQEIASLTGYAYLVEAINAL